MRLGIAVSLLATAGCRQVFGLDQASPAIDAAQPPADEPTEATASCAGVATGLLPMTCFLPATAIQLTGGINTDSDAVCDSARADGCFVVGTSITIDDTVRAQGTRPLVLWSASTIMVSPAGVIDVSSKFGQVPGAGANFPSCEVLDGPGTSVGAGGSGGSYASAGGKGGSGRADVLGTIVQNQNVGSALTVALRGGCPGGNGGLSQTTRGNSGGVIYLLAAEKITISGAILANGAGGLGAVISGGGGGGGSGGLIGLDAPRVVIDGAELAALGGAGGSGGTSGLVGARGSDADPSAPFVAAAGGGTTASNNAGGIGGGIDNDEGAVGGSIGVTVVGGGGGGGGGAGYVMAYGDLDNIQSQTQPPIRLN